MMRLTLVLVLPLIVAACSSEERQEERKKIVEDIHQPLNKAKAVEQQILDSAANQLHQIDQIDQIQEAPNPELGSE